MSDSIHIDNQEAPEIVPQIGPDGQPISPSEQVADVEKVEELDVNDNEILDEDVKVPVTEDGLAIDPKLAAQDPQTGGQKRVRRLATIMNMLNSLLGAGILSVPKSLKYTGIVPSIIILVIVAILSHIGTFLTIKLQYRTGAEGLDDLALKITKKPGQVILSILTMIFCYSAMVGYLIIGGKILKTWLELASSKINWTNMWIRALYVFIYAIIIPIPLILPRSIAFLSPFSFATVICICFFFVAMIIKGALNLPSGAETVIATGGMGIFSAISIYALAFALPIVVLPIVQPYNPDIHKRGVVSAWTCILCFILVAVPAVLGYLMFGDKTEDSILDNFANDDVLMIIVRIGFFLVVSFSYPCLGQSCLSSWSMVFYHVNQHSELPSKKRAVVLACTNVIPVVLACFLPDASPVLGVGGALGGCIVDFFYPALMWVLISKRPWTYWQNILTILFAAVGIIFGVICTYQSIVDAINSFK